MLEKFRANILKSLLGVKGLTMEMFSHTSPSKKGVSDFPDVVWFYFYTLLKFGILNASVSFHYRGHVEGNTN